MSNRLIGYLLESKKKKAKFEKKKKSLKSAGNKKKEGFEKAPFFLTRRYVFRGNNRIVRLK